MPRWCAVLCLAASVQAQPILIVRADSQARAQPDALPVVDARVRNVSVCLEAVKAEYRVVSDEAIGASSLAGVRLVVLPGTPVSEALTDLLIPFVAQGGQVAAFRTTGSARLPSLLGARVGAERGPDYPGELSGIELTDGAHARYAGLPGRFAEQAPARQSLSALAGAVVLGRWGRDPLERRAAVAGNANGCYVGDLFSTADRAAKGRFLLALAARDDPGLWQPYLSLCYAE
ncbi:MAG: hypothetical protein HYU66_22665, partial [Armatimonadetes bacterium]|nr:hypothetical protein [Armatimonadota bacterium]